MKERATIVVVVLLVLGMIIPQTLAATSQGLFYRMEDGNRFYFTLDATSDSESMFTETIYFEIENASKPIPDPLTDLADLDYPDVGIYYENGTSMGIMSLIFIFMPQFVFPVGNWDLIDSRAETDLEGLFFFAASDIVLSYTNNYWGYSYLYVNDDVETTVTVHYSLFDGMFSYYNIELFNTTTQQLEAEWTVSRFSFHSLEWGVDEGDRFDYRLVITGQIGTMGPLDEYLYIQVAEEGLSVIPYTLGDFVDIPDIVRDILWANDSVITIDYFDTAIRLAVPIGNWTLLDDLIDAVAIPGGVDIDDPDPWFWGFSWEIDTGDTLLGIHTDYLKVDGMIARHTVTVTNSSTLDVMGTISIERTGLLPYTDRTAPVINHPTDIEFVEGTENQTIIWGLIDVNPTTYEVSVNGTVVDSGSWTSGDDIVLDLEDFAAGEYSCIITAYDIAGNSASDEVMVIVTAAGGGLIDLIMDNILYIAIGAGAIIIIGAIVLMRRKS
ncbi:hypothetical protein E4H12_03125 [Candidatus Thorarchaeota archaeon]|nr:MAG: hypothetical protein E4H12_03125 [Candidatus Thorarchaeota archaeon]